MIWAQDVDVEFHARFSAMARNYKYLVYCHKTERPMLWKKVVGFAEIRYFCDEQSCCVFNWRA